MAITKFRSTKLLFFRIFFDKTYFDSINTIIIPI